MSVRGKMSRFAWAEGLRAALEKEYIKDIPPFDKLLRNAYHHWVAVDNAVQSSVMAEVEVWDSETGGWHNWQVERPENLCPGCFFTTKDPADTERVVTLAMDGNMQHKRFKNKVAEFEKFKPRMFVEYGRRDYMLSDSAPQDGDDGCSSNFKATKGWKKAELATLGKRNLDESGLMGICCTHGIGLRYLNMHGTGERQTHGVNLLDFILNHDPELQIRLCYDVACVFAPALNRLLPAEKASRIRTAIGRFHIYAHRYACHVKYNSLRTKGFALTSGELMEPNWYQMSHMIAQNRVSSSARKMQNIDSFAVYNALRQHIHFPRNLRRRWERTLELEKSETIILQEALERRVLARVDKGGREHPNQPVTIDYLEQQARDQMEYYRQYDGYVKFLGQVQAQMFANKTSEFTREPGDDIYQALREEERLALSYSKNSSEGRRLRRAGEPNLPVSFQELATYVHGRKAVDHTDGLLAAASATREDWAKGGVVYEQFEKRAALSAIRDLQTRIIHTITERATEQELLHRRLGQDLAKKFLESVNSRWKALEKLVESYNKEVRRAGNVRLRLLVATELKKNGLDMEEVWDIDLLMSRSDWAVYPFIRAAIEARFRLERAVEERVQLKLHCARMVEWCLHRVTVLLNQRDAVLAEKKRKLAEAVLHSYKVIGALLNSRLPGEMLSAENRERLLAMKYRIENSAYPEVCQRRLPPPPLPDPGLPTPSEEQGAESDDESEYEDEGEDEEFGGVIAEYLERELRDLVENTGSNQVVNEANNGQQENGEGDSGGSREENENMYHAMEIDSEAL